MKKILKAVLWIVLGLVVIAVAIVGIGVWYVNRYVQTPEFKHQLVGAASAATGTKVQLAGLKVSIFSGIDLQGVTIGNPGGFTGNLLEARAFTLHYRLWPLLQKRVEIETVTFDTPVINLIRNANGDWNYTKWSGRATTVETKAQPVATPTTTTAPSANVGGLDISLSNIEMKDATVLMATDAGQELLKIQNASFASTVNLSDNELSANGAAHIELVNLSNKLMLRSIGAPVTVTPSAVKLGPLTGKVADGSITGAAGLSLTGDSKYTATLEIKDADIVKMIREAGAPQEVFSQGKLQISTTLTGTAGLDTIVGSGKAEITGGQMVNVPLLGLIGNLLDVSALQNLKFDECVVQYTISNNVVKTPVISLQSPEVQITGKGSIMLADNTLNHTFTLTLAKGVLDHAPREIRDAFDHHDDGSDSIDFKVWGPCKSPKTDIQKRLLKAVKNQLLEQGLKLLK